MTMTPEDPLTAHPRGTAEEVIAFATEEGANRLDEVEALVEEFYRLAPAAGLDPAILSAQSATETGNFTNRWWTERLNAGSLGVTGDPAQDEASPSFADGVESARAMMTHLGLYVFGETLPPALAPYEDLDPRWDAAVTAGYAGIASVIQDLAGRWAADEHYADAISSRAAVIYADLPDAEEGGGGGGGDVASPVIHDLADDAAAADWGLSTTERNKLLAKCIQGRSGEEPHVIVLHIQQGYTAGSLDWHANKVQASATVYATLSGELVYGIREDDGPWTNGDVSYPTPKGEELLARYGSDPNVVTLSIESEDYSGDPVPDALLSAVVWQCRTWMDRYGIPIADVVRHADFNSDPDPDETREFCPGDVFYQRVIEALGGTPAPGYAYPEGLDEDLATKFFGECEALGKRFTYDEGQPVSSLWLDEGRRTGSYPSIRTVEEFDTRRYYRFHGGLTIWRPNADDKVRVLRD